MANANDLTPAQLQDIKDRIVADLNRENRIKGRLKLDLPPFSGAKGPLDAQGFLRDAEGYKDACGLNDQQLIQAVQFALREEAKTWGANLALVDDLKTMSWEDYRTKFEKRFGLSMSPSEKAKLAEGLKQNSGESVRAFYDRCLSAELILAATNTMYQNADEDTKKQIREQGICDKFLRGLREDGELKSSVNSMAPAPGQTTVSLREYYEAAIQREQTLGDKKRGLLCELSDKDEAGSSQKVEEVQRPRGEGRPRPDYSKMKCFICNQLGHIARLCKDNVRQTGTRPRSNFGFQRGRGRGGYTQFRGRGGSNGNFGRPRPANIHAIESALREISDTLAEDAAWQQQAPSQTEEFMDLQAYAPEFENQGFHSGSAR